MTRPEEFVDLEPELLLEQTLPRAGTIPSGWFTEPLDPRQEDVGIRFPHQR